jgi:RNA polymerase sigma factor (TIGR02999 family)
VSAEDYERSKTRYLELLRRHDPTADEFAEIVYEELHRLANGRRRPRDVTPSDLVHEAYPRLFRDGGKPWTSREHFFATAALAMHQLLVDRARLRAQGRRVPESRLEEFDENVVLRLGDHPIDLLKLDEALEEIRESDFAMYRAVHLRLYTTLRLDEIAAAIDVPMRSFERRWRLLEAWMWKRLGLSTPAD